MVRTLTLSAVVALLFGSVTFGAIGDIGPQTQAFEFGLTSNVSLLAGQGVGTNLASLMIGNGQSASTSEGTTALQGFGGLMGQSAFVTNVGSPIGILQETTIAGAQAQSFSRYGGPAGQGEEILVGAGQGIEKAENGAGDAVGTNSISMGMNQNGGTAFTTLGQGSLISGNQNSSLAGVSAASAGLVGSSFTAYVIQEQVVNCDVVVCPVTPEEPVEP